MPDKKASRRVAKSDQVIMDLEGLVSFRLSLLAKLLERRLAKLLGAEFGLAVAEYRVLAQVIMRPESTVRAIATRTLVDKAQVSRAVAALEEQALIVRSIPANDRRSPVLTATHAGRVLMRKIAPLRHAQEREVLAHLEPEAAEQLRTSLGALFEALTEPPDEPVQLSVAQRRRAEVETA